jgi:hypothetical protein
LSNASPFPGLDLTGISFAFTGAILTFTISRLHFLDVIPNRPLERTQRHRRAPARRPGRTDRILQPTSFGGPSLCQGGELGPSDVWHRPCNCQGVLHILRIRRIFGC